MIIKRLLAKLGIHDNRVITITPKDSLVVSQMLAKAKLGDTINFISNDGFLNLVFKIRGGDYLQLGLEETMKKFKWVC